MPIPTVIGDLSTTASLNSPAGSENLSTTDDYLRAVQGIVKTVYNDQVTINGTIAAKANLTTNTFTGVQTLASGAALNTSISTLASSATPDIWTNTSNVIDYTGTVTATGFATAPQAGVARTLILASTASFTAGTNMLIDGVVSFTGAAGDEVEVFAVTTTQFRLRPKLASGTAIMVSSKIQSILASVATSALTISAGALSLDFRSATLGSGTVTTVTGTPANLVVSSGSTLGTVNAIQSRLVVLALNNAGTIELAVGNIAGGVNLDETGVITTTAEGGAGAADSANVIYSTTARTGVAYRVIGYIESTQATAGTWATAPSTIQGSGGQALTAMSSLGYGQTWQNVTASRALTTTYYNTTGRPIMVCVSYSNSSGGNIQAIVNGVAILATGFGVAAVAPCLTFIVPPGGSYSTTNNVAAVVTWFELR